MLSNIFINSGGKNEKSLVGNAAVDVYAGVVSRAIVFFIYMIGLPAWIIERIAAVVGIGHIAQGARREDRTIHHIFPQFPIVPVNHDTEYIGIRFIDGAGFPIIFQIRCILNHPVRHLVAGHVERFGQRRRECLVAVAVKHRSAIPEGITHGRSIAIGNIDERDNITALAVDGVSVKGVFEIFKRSACVVMCGYRRGTVPGIVAGSDVGRVKIVVFRRGIACVYGPDGANRIIREHRLSGVEHAARRVNQEIRTIVQISIDGAHGTEQICSIGSSRRHP